MTRTPLRSASALALLVALAAPALAAGGGSSGGSGSGGPGGTGSKPADLTTCAKGLVWDARTKTCMKQSGALGDPILTDYAYALAKAHRYDEALQVLDLVADQTHARVLNYRGYITRKLGRTEEGVRYYLASVAADPDYVQVREYLGEAYVVLGRLDLAREQLARIDVLCGKACEEYEDLARAIETRVIED